MDYQNIHVEEKAEGIAVITLNRPDKRNAISILMRQEISHCLEGLKADPRIGCVVFIGAGSSFSAGFDLEEFKQRERFGELYQSSAKYHRDLWYFPLPTLAAVNGPAMGGGFDLVTFCDIRICSKKAVFGHPEIKFGAPPLFTPLRWIMGDGLARDLCLTGRRVDALEAYRIGLVSEVVEGDLLERTLAIGKSIMEAPLHTIRFVKDYLVYNAGRDFEESFAVEHDKAFREIILT
jgi:enoyl-CoA hydratase/carnithine racemase